MPFQYKPNILPYISSIPHTLLCQPFSNFHSPHHFILAIYPIEELNECQKVLQYGGTDFDVLMFGWFDCVNVYFSRFCYRAQCMHINNPHPTLTMKGPTTQPPPVLEQGLGPDAVDEVEIDFSPLRAPRDSLDTLQARADAVAAELAAVRVDPEAVDDVETVTNDSAAETDAAGGPAHGTGGGGGEGKEGEKEEEGGEEDEEEEEEEEEEGEEEEEWTGDPNNRPIWKFPVVSRVSRNCGARQK